jgi:hypothetical protein
MLMELKLEVQFMSKRDRKDKIIQISTETNINEGEKKTIQTQKIVLAPEPDYIKLYLNTLLTFKDLPKQLSSTLIAILKLMSYADPECEFGGQLISLQAFHKEQICRRLGIKMNTLNKSLTEFVKSGILKRIATGVYQANPNMFGRGEWLNIKTIRAKFDFNAGTVDADIQTEEEAES